MEQSPKSQRPHAPCERPPDDAELTEKEIGGVIRQQGPASSPRAPELTFSGGHHQGGFEDDYSPRGVTKAAELDVGSPGYVESDDAKKSGGTVERFTGER